MRELTEQDKRAFAEAIIRRRLQEAERLRKFIQETPAGAFVTYAPTPKARVLQRFLNAGMPLQQAKLYADLSAPSMN